MDAEKKRLRDEVAELAGAVRALRDEVAIARAAHHCHCGHCMHPWVYPTYQPTYVWSGAVTSGGYTVTNALSQGN